MNLDEAIDVIGNKITLQNFPFYKSPFLRVFADAYFKHKKKDDPYELYGIYHDPYELYETCQGLIKMNEPYNWFFVCMGYAYESNHRGKYDFYPILFKLRLVPEYSQEPEEGFIFDINDFTIDFYKTKYYLSDLDYLKKYEKNLLTKTSLYIDKEYEYLTDIKKFSYSIFPGKDRTYNAHLFNIQTRTERNL